MNVVATKPELLANDLAAVLADESAGLPAVELSSRLRRRRADVLAVLRDDPQFAVSGSGRGTRWRLAPQKPPDGVREQLGTEDSDDQGSDASPDSEPVGDALALPPASCSEPELHKSWGAHYVSSFGPRCIRCDRSKPPPLSDQEFDAGEGGEDRRQLYEEERHRRLVEAWRRASPEKREIFRREIREQMSALGLGV